jgi:hypothetical protein
VKVDLGIFLGLTAMGLLAPFAEGHFRLIEPKSWVVENEVGNPQKPGPCGGTEGAGVSPTNAVTAVQGGQSST